MKRTQVNRQDGPRCGAVLVETALVSSVFAILMAGIIEFGHAYLVVGSISAAARGAARHGAVEGVTTTQVVAEANRLLGASFNAASATVRVKNAGVFDTSAVDPKTINYEALPDVEVSGLKMGELFLVRVEVPYDAVAILPPFWAKGITLRSQSVVRHE